MSGFCPYGPRCHGSHDDSKLALCPSVLRHIECPAGVACSFSHVVEPERSPTCLFYMRGNCIRPLCPYSHVPVDPSAPLCTDFAYAGYCAEGTSCGRRHLRQCPVYTNTGSCGIYRCRLAHVDQASPRRRRTSTSGSDSWNAVTLVGSPTDDKCNDEQGPWFLSSANASRVIEPVSGQGMFTQQEDYIPL